MGSTYVIDTLADEANNQSWEINDGHAQFSRANDKEKLDFEDHFFDFCFSVNTVYFWNEPQFMFAEIYRVLRNGGIFSLAFIEQKHGKDLPWTHADFHFYETHQLKVFLRLAGFETIDVKYMTEEMITPDGQKIVRPFVHLTAKK